MEGDMDNSASQELVASNPEPRNWKGICISVIVILLVIVMVGFAVVWMTPPDPGPRVKGERIRLDTILDGKFKPNPFNATWVEGSKLVYINSDGGLSIFDAETSSTSELLDNATFRMLNSNTFVISPKLDYVMIVHDSQPIFRHSHLSKYTVKSLENRTLPPIRITTSLEQSTSPGSQQLLQWAEFVPGGGIVFVKDNNIYYKPNLSKELVHRVTTTGEKDTIYNGVADWLYEEEILGQTQALWLNPAGSRLAFIMFNDSMVEKVVLREYEKPKTAGSSSRHHNLREKAFRYPKAGMRNPTVRLFVHQLAKEGNGETFQVKPPVQMSSQDHYLCSVDWLDEDTVVALWMNRLQNKSILTLCSHPQYDCKQIHSEKSLENSGKGWVENRGLPIFSNDGDEMVLIHPIRDGDAGYFPQLVIGKVNIKDLIPATQLTHGQFEVTEIVAWDNKNNILYFISTLPGEPGVRHFHSVSTNGTSGGIRLLTCLTCRGSQSTNGIFSGCEYSEITVSKTFDAYVQNCLGPDIPSVHVFSLPDNKLIQTLDTNTRLHHQVAVSSMPRYVDLKIPLPGSPHPARVRLTLPPVLREYEDYQFPLVIHIYGGPGTQTVSSKWSIGWDTYLASNRNFIVANLDVRGSGFQGDDFKHAVFRQLGNLEVKDTLRVIRHLTKTLEYIDSSKVCIWGWSYGGYLAGLVLAEDGRMSQIGLGALLEEPDIDNSRILACGISVAPVTQWQNYDSAYTERFMGLPTSEGNWKGFTDSSLTGKADFISDNTMMVVHGTADDNVHIQHTMMLSKTLVENQIIFRQQIYPDESHGLHGVIRHEHQTMEAFMDDVFGPIEDFFEEDYYRAAAELLTKYERGLVGSNGQCTCFNGEECQSGFC